MQQQNYQKKNVTLEKQTLELQILLHEILIICRRDPIFCDSKIPIGE